MSSVSGIGGAIEEPRRGELVADRRASGRGGAPPIKPGRSPLLPETGSSGAPLTAVIAVISSLACVALAAFILTASAARNWTTDLKASVTVQVKGADVAEIDERAARVAEVLSASPEVASYTVISSKEAAKLLEPWLGKGNADTLNVPALIELKLAETGRKDLSGLSARLAAAAPGVVLDDHGDWNERLAVAARSGQLLAFAIFALIMGAACAIAIFASRAGLAANAEVVALLHLVGATDRYIAGEVQRRFTIIGLRGALIGLFIAYFLIGLFAMATRPKGAEGAFLPGLDLGYGLALPMLLVPIAICLVTAVSARLTVLKTLGETY
ncbi:MAG: cell division protein FtsX [Parvularculaceae bacterium]